MKRKQVDGMMGGHTKKRREGDEGGEGFESDIGAQGAKHWTDEEKSKLFNWLMGLGQDDHWNALRATKNSCLREVCRGPLFICKRVDRCHGSVQLKCSEARKHIRPSKAVTNATSTFFRKSTPLKPTMRRQEVVPL
jgi:hypothetical protein